MIRHTGHAIDRIEQDTDRDRFIQILERRRKQPHALLARAGLGDVVGVDHETADGGVIEVGESTTRIPLHFAIGATETIFPERESARNLAGRLSNRDILNYVRLGAGFSIQEMVVPDPWEGRTLRDLNLRTRYQLSVVAIHDVLRDQMIVRLRFEGEKLVKEERLLKGAVGRIRDVRAGPDGFVYFLDESNGVLARLEPAG